MCPQGISEGVHSERGVLSPETRNGNGRTHTNLRMLTDASVLARCQQHTASHLPATNSMPPKVVRPAAAVRSNAHPTPQPNADPTPPAAPTPVWHWREENIFDRLKALGLYDSGVQLGLFKLDRWGARHVLSTSPNAELALSLPVPARRLDTVKGLLAQRAELPTCLRVEYRDGQDPVNVFNALKGTSVDKVHLQVLGAGSRSSPSAVARVLKEAGYVFTNLKSVTVYQAHTTSAKKLNTEPCILPPPSDLPTVKHVELIAPKADCKLLHSAVKYLPQVESLSLKMYEPTHDGKKKPAHMFLPDSEYASIAIADLFKEPKAASTPKTSGQGHPFKVTRPSKATAILSPSYPLTTLFIDTFVIDTDIPLICDRLPALTRLGCKGLHLQDTAQSRMWGVKDLYLDEAHSDQIKLLPTGGSLAVHCTSGLLRIMVTEQVNTHTHNTHTQTHYGPPPHTHTLQHTQPRYMDHICFYECFHKDPPVCLVRWFVLYVAGPGNRLPGAAARLSLSHRHHQVPRQA